MIVSPAYEAPSATVVLPPAPPTAVGSMVIAGEAGAPAAPITVAVRSMMPFGTSKVKDAPTVSNTAVHTVLQPGSGKVSALAGMALAATTRPPTALAARV